MMASHRTVLGSALITASALLAGPMVQEAGAAAMTTAPYTNDFSGTSIGLDTGNQTGTGGTGVWTPTSGMAQDQFQGGAFTTTNSYAAIAVTNLGGVPATASDFTIESDVVVTDVTSVNSSLTATVGLTALGNANTFRDFTGDTFYVANLQVAHGSANGGSLGAMSLSGGGSGNFNGTIALNTVYHLTLTGTYDASGLTLAFTVDDPTDSNSPTTISTLITSGILTGDHFGYRDRAQNGGATVQFDNLSINNAVVPEPASAGLLLFVGAGMVLRRRSGSRSM
jgi:hypothetical protein